jgi:hypothetical protein
VPVHGAAPAAAAPEDFAAAASTLPRRRSLRYNPNLGWTGEQLMKRAVWALAGLILGMVAAGAAAATKHPAEKGPPACAALTFRAVPSGAGDGDRQAGFYRSRYGTLALHADVKNGQPADYFVLADGKKLAAAPATIPDWAANCAEKKQLPKPAATAAAPCTGQRFRVVLAHDASQRLALLYGYDGSTWHYCSAGSY